MHILVSNDDGYLAEGIRKLNAALARPGPHHHHGARPQSQRRQQLADAGCAAAGLPERARRALRGRRHAHRLRAHRHLRAISISSSTWSCSGINDGANLGDDTLYSGTVAAAIEGRFLGLPTVAFSLCMEPDSGRQLRHGGARGAGAGRPSAGAAAGTRHHAERQRARPALDELKGIRATRLGGRHRSKPIVPVQDPQGQAHVLDRPVGRRPGCGRGHGLPRHRQWLCFGHAAADRPDPPRRAARRWPNG